MITASVNPKKGNSPIDYGFVETTAFLSLIPDFSCHANYQNISNLIVTGHG